MGDSGSAEEPSLSSRSPRTPREEVIAAVVTAAKQSPSTDGALAYANLQQITVKASQIEVYCYMAEPEGTTRIVVPKILAAESRTTNKEIMEMVRIGNPNLRIVNARRMGRSQAILVSSAPKEHRTILCTD
ncbi:hypothetical protein HPB47_021769 [Ixodes persulcatus]|uniref:Uncharacterized protein n=1 Tax=Ixodes persulcatus TaxID=34615 RepID=A0AC60QBQ3_IXOPE|nr:hypothetical protein HPB47_021769 [Ixodes persulcatus]